MRSVLLLGATGLVGRELLTLLFDDDDVQRVVVIARRPTGAKHARLDEHVIDLDAMESHAELFAVDQIFCALGTTIKLAGSQERFRVVDHDYAVTAARLGKARGARHYLLVSALGANAESRVFYNRVKGEVEYAVTAARLGKARGARHYLLVSALGANAESRVFYNRVKGEVERDVIAAGYRSTTIARPSLLLGNREEYRRGERIASKFAWLTPSKYKPIQARDVARALVRLAREDAPGVKIVESRELRLSYAR